MQNYKDNIGKMEELEVHLAEVKREIYDLSFSKGTRDKARLKELNEDKIKTTNRININDNSRMCYELIPTVAASHLMGISALIH